MKQLGPAVLGLAMSACAAAPVVPQPGNLLADHLFERAAEPVPDQSIFATSPAMQAYLDGEMADFTWAKGRHTGLLEALRNGGLKLEYDTEYTRTAAEAFEARSGNCLSLVILAAAFADEIGIPYTFQLVQDDGTWQRAGTLAFRSGHVNLALGISRPMGEFRTLSTGRAVIDFMPRRLVAHHTVLSLPKETVVAMYHNNRAAELLASGDVNSAYWWAREAVRIDPAHSGSWNTLGVVYQRHGELAMAEQVFRRLLDAEPDDAAVLGNLAGLLSRQGRDGEAMVFSERLAKIQPYPPYYFMRRGYSALEQGDSLGALVWFRREAERMPYEDEVHFGMALASLRLGEFEDAREFLSKAAELSGTRDRRQVYAAKLQHLQQMQGDL